MLQRVEADIIGAGTEFVTHHLPTLRWNCDGRLEKERPWERTSI